MNGDVNCLLPPPSPQMLTANWHQASELWECVGLLARLVNNVVSCRNSVEKFRRAGRVRVFACLV